MALQEKYEKLSSIYKNLMEDISKMTDEEIERWVSQNAQNPEQAAAQREMLKNRREKARQANVKTKPQEQAQAKPKAKPQAKPQSGPKPAPGRDPLPSEEGFDEFIKKKAEDMRQEAAAKKQAEAEAARAAKSNKSTAAETPKTKTSEQVKPQGNTTQPKANAPKQSSKVVGAAKGLGKGVAGFGIGLGGYYAGRAASDVALSAAGVENETAKDIAGEAVGGAAGGVAATTAGSLMTGAGLPAAGALGAAALKGGLAGLAAYGGFKAGEAISNIEVDDKGTTVSDVGGKKIYDIYGKMTGKGTSSEQLNTPKTGVSGGDPNKIEQNAKEEAEEDAAKKAKMEELKAKARGARRGAKL